MNEQQYLKWKPIAHHRQGYISVINNSFKGLIISLIDYNYYKIRTRTQKKATHTNTLQLAQKTDGILSNNEWVSSHLLYRDESEPDLYYAQLEPTLMSRPPTGCLTLKWIKQVGSDRWTDWDFQFHILGGLFRRLWHLVFINQFSKK